MIDQFVGFCLHRRVAVFILAALLAAYGIYAWETLSVEAYPELGDVAAQVTTQVPGLAAEEIEQLITVPLEREINGTPGLLLMRSSSTFGLSLITVLFRDGYEDYWARQRLLERINQAVLPPGAAPSLDPVAGPGGEIYRYTLESDTKNLQELSEIQRWTVIPALKSVPGVVDDTNFGGFTTEYELDLDPKQLQHYGLGITDVINAINNNNTNAGGGRVSRGDQSYVIRGVGLIHTLAEMGSIVVTQVGGTPVLVRDLGHTALSHQEREGILGKDKNPDTIEGIVLMLKYQNPSQTLQGVHAKVAELNAKLAGADVRIVPYIDREDLVRATIHKVGQTILEGITLVFLILILFLGSPRSAFVVAVSIPMALVSVFSLLNLTHVSANLLSLGAIDFGILVDGAIVVTEAVLRRREALPNEELSESEAKAATLQVTRGHPGDATNLLREPDHHHRLPAAVLVRARGGQTVYADGLYDGICAVRRAIDRAGSGAGPGISLLSKTRRGVPQPLAGAPDGILRSSSRRLPRSTADHLWGGDFRAADRRRFGGDGGPRLPAGSG
jgi:cobalt-zinc-cadmium resistance protein CzcA